ncbi:MAG: HD domain-containing protein [candidate division KSB1 bacterium]|nr:HD domain-containing protein [candidate division KSB1 bacterium]
MRDKLRALFPELEWIQDRSLQDKVLAVWEEAVREGGWEVQELENIPFTLLIPGTQVSLVAHTRAVTQIARAGAQVLRQALGFSGLDMDHLIAGALLHDVGKLLEFHRGQTGVERSPQGRLLRHPFSGAGLATKHGLPEQVVHIIATHAKEGDGGYRSPEAVLVHHADFMCFDSLKA